MTEEEARTVFFDAICATNYVSGGGREGYKSLLQFIIYSLDADHGECAVLNVMRELGWESTDET